MRSLVIFIPGLLKVKKDPGYLIGLVENVRNDISFYVVDKIANVYELSNISQEFTIIGFDYAEGLGLINVKGVSYFSDFITISQSHEGTWHVCLQKIKQNNIAIALNLNPVIVYYDYEAFLYSYVDNNGICNADKFIKPFDHFLKLSELIKIKSHGDKQKRRRQNKTITFLKNSIVQLVFIILVNISKTLNYISFIGKYSAFVRNLRECVDGTLDIWKKGSRLQKSSLLVTILTDIAIGAVTLWWIKDIYHPVGPLLDGAEYIVTYLRELLRTLMGSPVGLKLNRAFNTMLGRCFLYHIELWYIFLVQLSPWICQGFNFLLCLGTLGLSFQAAMLCDIVSMTTFHVHCIYVYAAKLYNIQINGVKALWRLFLGRKYNPLRDRVDSCSYNNRQLFIGTLGFTIFLFLLPTTTLYYVVFTTLRIFMLLMLEILDWTREILHSLPIYTAVLWMLGSTAVPSTAHLALEKSVNLIYASVRPLSPWQHHRLIPPAIKHTHRMQWSGIFSKIVNGELLTQF